MVPWYRSSWSGFQASPPTRLAPCWSTRRTALWLQPECEYSSTKVRLFRCGNADAARGRDGSRARLVENGELLDVAEKEGFAVLVTTDANLKYQQNLSSRTIAIVVLTTTSWPRIQRSVSAVVTVDGATSGSYVEVEIP